MTKRKPPSTQKARLPSPRSRYPGVHGKVVDGVEHVFEEGMLYVRVRFTDKTELCWVLQTAHVILEADLSDWKTGNCKQLRRFVENESDYSVQVGGGSSHPPFRDRHLRQI
jgi:hypothetical protein